MVNSMQLAALSYTDMPLQNLPVEILCMILRRIRKSHLQKQLLVCKWWYKLAEPILLEELTLSASQLTRLPEQVHKRQKLFLRRLNIDVHGTRDWPVNTDNELDQILGSLIRDCQCLNSFTLRARSQFDPAEPLAPRDHYLSGWSPARLLDNLQVSKISNLEIDTCGSEFKHDDHVCPQLAHIIPHLRNVRLRMHTICPRIFDWKTYGPSPPKIESAIVNVSLIEPNRFFAKFSHYCSDARRPWQLYDDMVDAAEKLTKQIPTPSSLRVLRILSHKPLSCATPVAKNCIAGTKVVLNHNGDRWYRGAEAQLDPSDQEFSSTDSEGESEDSVHVL